jgi:3-deoxy-D-manno-octulosonic-acid transferase
MASEAVRGATLPGGVLRLYRTATALLAPAIGPYLRLRRARGKEDGGRLAERFGRAGGPRPPGPLVWLHAASVGEAASLLALIDRLAAERPALGMLVTTGTVTSARLLAARLPAGRAWHQFVPVDGMRYVARFLDHWRPDLAIWVESELWPNLVAATQARGIPCVLLNARMSERSFARWQRWRGLIAPLLGGFALCLAQDAKQRDRLAALGAPAAETVGDLKAAAAALPVDEAELARLDAAIAGRPRWLAASTHPGEEEAALAAHRRLARQHPGLLTLIAPRHPARAEEILELCRRASLTVAQRSRGEMPERAIYLADTMGEMGLVYRLAEIAFVGGSLTPRGGHNPLEPARLGRAILHGPDTSNCAATASALGKAGGARLVASSEALADALGELLSDGEARRRMGEAALAVAATEGGVLDAILVRLAPFLDRIAPPDAKRARA